MKLSYSDLVDFLCWMNRIAPDSEAAFRARLRHFQRLGFPEGSNTGKGKRAKYDLDMLLQLVIAIQFMQAGMTPQRIVHLVTKNWNETRTYLLFACAPEPLVSADGDKLSNELVLCVSPESLRDITTDGESDQDYYEAFNFVEAEKLGDFFKQQDVAPLVGEPYRWHVILLRPLIAIVVLGLESELKYDAGETFNELQRIVRHHADQLMAAMVSFDSANKAGHGNP